MHIKQTRLIQPQAESVNNTFGRTVNPLNRKLTSGGSSGGEAALIAFGGSPLGVGTDIVGQFLHYIHLPADKARRAAACGFLRHALAYSHCAHLLVASQLKDVRLAWQGKRLSKV